MSTLCCSNICERRNECARHSINNEGIHHVEDFYSFGSATMTENDCKIEFWCNKLGDWKMFEPIYKEPDVDKDMVKDAIKNAEQKVYDLCGCNIKT